MDQKEKFPIKMILQYMGLVICLWQSAFWLINTNLKNALVGNIDFAMMWYIITEFYIIYIIGSNAKWTPQRIIAYCTGIPLMNLFLWDFLWHCQYMLLNGRSYGQNLDIGWNLLSPWECGFPLGRYPPTSLEVGIYGLIAFLIAIFIWSHYHHKLTIVSIGITGNFWLYNNTILLQVFKITDNFIFAIWFFISLGILLCILIFNFYHIKIKERELIT